MDPRTARDLRALEFTEEEWAEARLYFDVLSKLAGRRLTHDMVVHAQQVMGVSRTKFYRLRSSFEADPTLAALITEKRGWKKGASRVNEKRGKLIERAIREGFEQKEKPRIEDALSLANAYLYEAGEPNTTYRTVRGIIEKRDQLKLMRRREGRKAADAKYKAYPGGFHADRLLEVVQIDHAKVDVFVVDEERHVVLKRPWLTVALDVASRMIVGFYLAPHAPQRRSVAMALAHAVLPKEDFCQKLGINLPYPAHGIMSLLHMDNAKEFRAPELARACENFGIDTYHRPIATPHYGGHIERVCGTLLHDMHLLPGTTKSNSKERGDYPSEARASLTFGELEKWVALEIVGKYHNQIHSSLNMTPLAKWQELMKRDAPTIRLPHSPSEFWINFLPEDRRKILRQGISLNGLTYYDALLNRYVGSKKRVAVKWDPYDISKIWIEEAGSWQPIRCAKLDFPASTIWELRGANALERRKGRHSSSPEVLRESILAQREIMENAEKLTGSARAARERNRHARAETGTQTKPRNRQKIIDVDFDTIDVDPASLMIEDWSKKL